MAADPRYEASFFETSFSREPERDMRMQRTLLFDHIRNLESGIQNPMSISTDDTLMSLKDCILDLISSKHKWIHAIKTEEKINNINKIQLSREILTYSDRLCDCLLHNDIPSSLSDYEYHQHTRTSRTLIKHASFIQSFISENAHLFDDHPSDADEPLDIFKIKLPVNNNGDHGSVVVCWTSLENVMRDCLNDSISPKLPQSDDFCPLKYIRKIFNARTISHGTTTAISLIKIMTHISRRVSIVSDHSGFSIWVKDHRETQHTGIGKIRYTLALILRWIELTHYCLFTDQVSHSVLYSFYKNIRVNPIVIRSDPYHSSPFSGYTHICAHSRTLTKDTMPDEENDPVLLMPFEEGMIVYKMACCTKDISQESILGILKSGRSPKCPMCRGDLLTTDTTKGFSSNPILKDVKEPEEIIIIPDGPSYTRYPFIPEYEYRR